MPESFVSFTLKKEMFEKLMKGVTTLNLPDVSVVGDGKNITLRASDRKNNTSNTYSVDVEDQIKSLEGHYKAENFKLGNR